MCVVSGLRKYIMRRRGSIKAMALYMRLVLVMLTLQLSDCSLPYCDELPGWGSNAVPADATRHLACKLSKLGKFYRGHTSFTNSGLECQRWDSQVPHKHTRNNATNFPDLSVTDAANYCRNPDNEPLGPWCYTTDPNTRWEYCPIPMCDCKKTPEGYYFEGQTSVTASGKTCQRWESQDPHEHNRNNPTTFPDVTIADAANYCRNPDGEPLGPWCYTTDPNTRWEYCNIPLCFSALTCKMTELGLEYEGFRSSTISGRTCQRWDSQYPHKHERGCAECFPDTSIASAANYCRNPDSEAGGPWCYTTDSSTRWEYCSVPKCNCKLAKLGTLYQGHVSTTQTGLMCQRWDSQFPHRHTRTDPDKFPDGSLKQAANYCRNPDLETGGPWCYTTNSGVRWQYCGIPDCINFRNDKSEDCKLSKLGTFYEGQQATTESGLVCQRWDSQSPQKHTRNDSGNFPDGSIAQAANYCRNPDNEPNGPWCYTTDPGVRWQYCDIPECDNLSSDLPVEG